jgi:hypothetical protein
LRILKPKNLATYLVHAPIDMNPMPLGCRKTDHSLYQPGNRWTLCVSRAK